jgi:S1-C subfamily serine protease
MGDSVRRPGTWSVVVPFVLGFACCALVARFVLVPDIAATSPGSFVVASPAQIVDAVSDSVVSIEALPANAPSRSANAFAPLIGLPTAAAPEPNAVASGVIISGQGYVVTNDHVVAGGGKIRVRLLDGREFDGAVVGRDSHSDLAVVKIPGRKIKPAQIGNSRRVRAGDSVVAIGNPLGFENSVSVGVVSANRSGPFRVDGRTLGDMIQTDAAINQGNSGGGLFTADGRLVGINTAIITGKGGTGSIGIGFAVPAHRMRPVVNALIAKGRVPRPWLGIKYQAMRPGPFVRRIRHGAGVFVEEVLPSGPAARAGLQPSDLIRQLGACPIHSPDDMHSFMDRYQPGEKVKARILRDGREKTALLTLGEKPD